MLDWEHTESSIELNIRAIKKKTNGRLDMKRSSRETEGKGIEGSNLERSCEK